MLPLHFGSHSRGLRVLAVGAHADDIEIGAGGTLLSLAATYELDACVVVLSGTDERVAEASASTRAFLAGATVVVKQYRLTDGRFPAEWLELKDVLEEIGTDYVPDLILAPRRADAHQDHRTAAELLSTVFRNHLILRYEIPKWDGDLGRPSVYVPLDEEVIQRKVELLQEHYTSQRARSWFDERVFLGLARLRGMECGATFAEAFECDKAVLAIGSVSL